MLHLPETRWGLKNSTALTISRCVSELLESVKGALSQQRITFLPTTPFEIVFYEFKLQIIKFNLQSFHNRAY